MSVAVQHRRGSRTNAEANTPLDGELWWDQTLKAMRMGDGAQAGGFLHRRWGSAYTVTPAQITSNQNDYNPTDLAIAEALAISSDAARDITGLQNGAANRSIMLVNTGANTITLKDASSSSSAGNRFSFGRDFQLRANYAIGLLYVAASSRWFAITDAFAWRTISDIPENLTLSGDITPTQITSNQNDYAPTGAATATTFRLSTDASRNITGMTGGTDGQIRIVLNAGSFAIVLKNADTNSTAANRFDIGADQTLAAKNVAVIQYDATDSRWKLLSSTAGAAVADGAVTAVKLAGSALDGQRGMVNGKLAISQNGTVLTCAVKTLAGTDPSASDPVYFVFNDGTGGYVVRSVVAALSFAFSSGSSAGFTNGAAGRIWWLAFDDAGTVRLAGVNCRLSGGFFPLDESSPASSTAEGGAGGADSAGTVYTGTAVTTKYFRILGRSEWDSGVAVAGTWNADPSRSILFAPGSARPGAILQTVSASRTTQDSFTSVTYTNTNVTVSITPTSKHNLVSVHSYGGVMIQTSGDVGGLIIQRGGSNVGIGQQFFGSAASFQSSGTSMTAIDAPASIASVTYVVAAKITTGGGAHTIIFPNTATAEVGAAIFASEVVA